MNTTAQHTYPHTHNTQQEYAQEVKRKERKKEATDRRITHFPEVKRIGQAQFEIIN